jgi:GAF domain-containing protein
MELDPKVLEIVRRPSRLRALAALQANAESSAQALDRITRIACRALGVPVAIVNLIGAERQAFMGCGSLPEPWASMREMPLTAGWCPFALGAQDSFTFADAREEPSIAGNPASERLGVVAYAGVPLRGAGGEPIGTLCALDYERHDWTDEEIALLTDLAAEAVDELQLLAASRVAAREHARLHAIEELSMRLATTATPDDVLSAVMAAVERTDSGAIWQIAEDESGRSLGTAACAGARATSVTSSTPVPLDAPLAHAEVARAAEPRFLTSRSAVRDGFGLDAAPDVGSVALLPVRAGGRCLGVLAACFRDERTFSDEDREYLEALAGMSGLALRR